MTQLLLSEYFVTQVVHFIEEESPVEWKGDGAFPDGCRSLPQNGARSLFIRRLSRGEYEAQLPTSGIQRESCGRFYHPKVPP